jgi:hypothetical protein
MQKAKQDQKWKILILELLQTRSYGIIVICSVWGLLWIINDPARKFLMERLIS